MFYTYIFLKYAYVNAILRCVRKIYNVFCLDGHNAYAMYKRFFFFKLKFAFAYLIRFKVILRKCLCSGYLSQISLLATIVCAMKFHYRLRKKGFSFFLSLFIDITIKFEVKTIFFITLLLFTSFIKCKTSLKCTTVYASFTKAITSSYAKHRLFEMQFMMFDFKIDCIKHHTYMSLPSCEEDVSRKLQGLSDIIKCLLQARTRGPRQKLPKTNQWTDKRQ
jgi:hypothetical protein